MKNLVLISLIIISAFFTKNYAQVENRVQFGLRVDPSINFLSAVNKNLFDTKGTIMGVGAGLEVDYKFNNVVSLNFGLEYRLDGGKYQTIDSIYYRYKNKELTSFDNEGGDIYKLDERTLKANYLNLPLNLKFRSADLGILKIYGLAGMNLGFKLSSTADDVVEKLTSSSINDDVLSFGQAEVLDQLQNTSDVQAISFGFQVGGGVEISIAKSMALELGLKYMGSMININKSPSKYLVYSDGSSFNPAAKTRAIALSVGIIF